MTTTARPRPTRHQLDELTGRLNAAITCAEERLDQITTLTEHRDELRAQMAKLLDTRDNADSEALALAECVQALDAHTKRVQPRHGSGDYLAMAVAQTHHHRHDPTTQPIGRILLYLAHRYNIDLAPTPPPTPTTDPRFGDLLADLTHATERYRIDTQGQFQ